ncbi:hypothetical protein FQR65_LT11811 [Abscondita terminalis]|nr:hypothetical protein FQR65_LT11811 [Abscondita terminalis]
MVRAWYMDSDPNDQRLEHHRNPPEFLTIDEVFRLSGVEYFSLDVNTYKTDGILDGIKKKRGYTYEDELVCSKECLPNYEEKLKTFFTEHLHTDEEIRFVIEGSGFFDVRDKNDEWIRVEVVSGDMIVLPKGIYHRFTLDMNNYVKVKRFFIGEPVWTAHNRPVDEMECRKQYVESMKAGFVTV